MTMTHEEKERLLLLLMPQIRHAAHSFFMRSGICRDDLDQEATMAVWKLLDDYDPSLGTPGAFVARRIKGSLQDYARSSSHILGNTRGRNLGKVGSLSKMADSERNDTLGALIPDHRRNRMHEVLQREDFDDHLLSCYPDERALLTRIYIDGVEKVAIAKERHVSPTLIGTHTNRAFVRIRANQISRDQQ
jgi:RNA polymerase sigma factor (sigma-70 family)